MQDEGEGLNVGLTDMVKENEEKEQKDMRRLAKIAFICLLLFCIFSVGNAVFQALNYYSNGKAEQRSIKEVKYLEE